MQDDTTQVTDGGMVAETETIPDHITENGEPMTEETGKHDETYETYETDKTDEIDETNGTGETYETEETMVGPCEECASTVEADLDFCPECGHDANKKARKQTGYFIIFLAGASFLFPPALLVTIPASILIYWAVRKHEFVVVDEDRVEATEA